MPDTTAKHGIARPQTSDFISGWPATMRTALDWLDANIALAITTTPRPAAGVFGRLHRAADGEITFDTGSAWVSIPSGSVAARLQPGAADPLTVVAGMIGVDVPMVDIGVQLPTASSVLPASGKFAWCDGSLIRADLYPTFAANVGNAYNGGVAPGNDVDGHPLVRLPNKAGRGSIGSGAGAGLTNRTRGARLGAEEHVLTVAQMPPHNHDIIVRGVQGPVGLWFIQGTQLSQVLGTEYEPDNPLVGGGQAHPNMPPVEVDNWIVRIA